MYLVKKKNCCFPLDFKHILYIDCCSCIIVGKNKINSLVNIGAPISVLGLGCAALPCGPKTEKKKLITNK